MFERVTKPESRWRFLWPDVSDLAGAEEGIRLGYFGAFLGAIVTIALGVFGMLIEADAGSRHNPLIVGVASLIDAAVLALLGLGVLRKWRSAAVVGLAVFSTSLVMTVARGAFPGVVGVFILFAFVGAVRGTFAYHTLMHLTRADSAATTTE